MELRAIGPGEPVGNLSGGEQTKLALLEAFASAPDVLLLDEPTNNLDLQAAAWLDERLASFPGAVVIVSHDRALLDDHATSILELDPRSLRAEVFAGNYSDYAAEKARRRDAQWAAYRRQQDHERRVRQEISAIKSTASRREHLTQNDFYRRKAKKVARRAVVLERRLERGLDSEDRVEKPIGREYTILPQVASSARGGDRMLSAEGLRLSAGGRVLLDGASLNIGWGERVVIIGANGTGKTTLLRALVGEDSGDAGEVRHSPSLKLGYLPQEDVAQPPPAVQSSSATQRHASDNDPRDDGTLRDRSPPLPAPLPLRRRRRPHAGRGVELRRTPPPLARKARARRCESACPRRADEPPRHPLARGIGVRRSTPTTARSSPSPTTATSSGGSHRDCWS